MKIVASKITCSKKISDAFYSLWVRHRARVETQDRYEKHVINPMKEYFYKNSRLEYCCTQLFLEQIDIKVFERKMIEKYDLQNKKNCGKVFFKSDWYGIKK